MGGRSRRRSKAYAERIKALVNAPELVRQHYNKLIESNKNNIVHIAEYLSEVLLSTLTEGKTTYLYDDNLCCDLKLDLNKAVWCRHKDERLKTLISDIVGVRILKIMTPILPVGDFYYVQFVLEVPQS